MKFSIQTFTTCRVLTNKMAFSTQQDFFHVPFMNETVAYACKPACVKLKSYESSLDYRSWSSDRAKQSKFLSDLVTCQIPVGILFL